MYIMLQELLQGKSKICNSLLIKGYWIRALAAVNR